MSNSNMMTVRKLRPGVAKTKGDIYRGAACAFEEVRREADQGLKRHRTSLASGGRGRWKNVGAIQKSIVGIYIQLVFGSVFPTA